MFEKLCRVSEAAVIRRINRKLKPETVLRKCRQDSRRFYILGNYYLIDQRGNFVVDTQIDLEHCAREVGALHSGEAL